MKTSIDSPARARLRAPLIAAACVFLLGHACPARGETTREWVEQAPGGFGGMSGLINTPTADVLADGYFRVGYARYDKKVAYDLRGVYDNEVYSLAVGFLPRTEVLFRVTAFPGEKLVEGADVSNLDRMVGGRILVLPEGRLPAVAVGLDDPRGTRRFHALYIVASKTVAVADGTPAVRVTAGYGSTLLEARRYVLDGVFGGAELRVTPFLSVMAEHDSEKWNAGGRLTLFRRAHLHAAVMDLETFSGGFGWTHRF